MNRKRGILQNLRLGINILFSVRNIQTVFLDLLRFRTKDNKLTFNNGLVYIFRPHSSDLRELIMVNSNFEYPWHLMKKYTNPMLIVDLGAHIGGFSILAKKTWPLANVIAVEPMESNSKIFEQNALLNKMQFDLKTVAVGPYRGEFGLSKKNDYDSWFIDENGENKVECVLLADILPPNTIPDLLKIDIEGAEYAVLDQSIELISQIQLIVLEYHNSIFNFGPRKGDERNYLDNYFRGLGFHVIEYSDHIILAVKQN